jgi:DNA-binding winged helix-turn-helix (wHTH) protein/tetratricopeptide (TPR) repeat protein
MSRSSGSHPLRVRFGEFELDEANALLLRGGSAIPLAPTPFGLLCALVRQPGSLLTKHALLDQVWGHIYVSDSVLKTAISDLRTVLVDDPRHPRYIETVARRGYRFIAVTTPLSVAAAQAPGNSPPAASAPTSEPQAAHFVGRLRELARLRRAWDSAGRGKRAVFWIAGEPGIGKTTLIEHFVSGLGDIACARGQCVEHYGTGEPYLPVLEALGQLCRADASVAPLLSAVAPTWLLQLPWLSNAEQRESLRRELVGVSPDRMLRELGELLDRYTEHRPLLLVTEDLHWGDRATTQLIDYVARRRSSARLMWLSSFRLTEVIVSNESLNAVRHELRLHGLCEEIVLDPFSETEVAAYIAEYSPSMAADEGFVRALHERTDGVPLFVSSVTNDVIARAEQHGRDHGDTASLASMPVPEDLTAIIDHYMHRLDDERRSLLSAAAVCGVDFRSDTLARVLQRDASHVTEACDQLVREQRWITAPGARGAGDLREKPYSFRHALFREVLYDRMAPLTRAELHRKVGAALEDERAAGLAVTAAELAMHFERGRAPMAALRYYAEGAETSLLHLRPAECMSLTKRALTLLDHTPGCAERTSLEITLATLGGVSAFHVLGAGDETKIALQRACSLLADHPAHPMRGLTLHGLGFLLTVRGEFADALATADRAEALASRTGDTFLPLAACTVRGHVYMHQGRPGAARDALERALPAIEGAEAAFERRFIADPCVTLLAMLSLPLANLGLVTQARERLQQAYERARQLGQPMALLVTLWFDALLEVRLGDVDRVAMIADEMRALVDEYALAQGKAACRWFRGWANARKGQALEGFRQIRDAHDENTALGMLAGASENLGYAAEAALLHGDWHAAQEQLDQALEIVETYGERIYLPQLLLIEGAIAHARGKPDAAIASIRRATEEARAQGAGWLELLALTELCEREAASAEDRRALVALTEQLAEAGGTPALARARALLAGAESA